MNTTAPRLGQRVRFTCADHISLKHGSTGMIELVSGSKFWVLTDEGGFFGWTSLDSWEPTGEPDVVLPADYVAMRQEVSS